MHEDHDLALSYVAWLYDKREELGEKVWRNMFLADPLHTNALTDFRNALRLAGLLGDIEEPTGKLILGSVVDFLRKHASMDSNAAARELGIARATVLINELWAVGKGKASAVVAPPDDPDESLRPQKSIKPRLNVFMVHLLQVHGQETCVPWSVRDWATRLEPVWGKRPSTSTIHNTHTWKLLQGHRGDAQARLIDQQTAKDERGKRRSIRF